MARFKFGSSWCNSLTRLGGISFFSPRFGFVCDNVINYEVSVQVSVLMNIEIIMVASTSNVFRRR